MSRADELRAAKERRVRRQIGEAIQTLRQQGVGRGPCPKCFPKRAALIAREEADHGR